MLTANTFTPTDPGISVWDTWHLPVGLGIMVAAAVIIAMGCFYHRDDWLRRFFDHFCVPLFWGAFLLFFVGVGVVLKGTDDMNNAVNDSYTAQFIDHLKTTENVKSAKGFIRAMGSSRDDKPGSNQFTVTYTDGTSGLIQYTYDGGEISYFTLATEKD